MRERLHGYLNDVRLGNTGKPVSRHSIGDDHSLTDIDVTIITTTTKDTNNILRTEETYIAKFRTKQPEGLNIIQ